MTPDLALAYLAGAIAWLTTTPPGWAFIAAILFAVGIADWVTP